MVPRAAPAIAILATVALLSATGGAVAGGLITSAEIKDDTIKSVDVQDASLKKTDLARRTVKSLQGAQGPAGPAGAQGAAGPAGAQGLVGPAGLVRGYGYVTREGAILRQSGGIVVTDPGPFPGSWCITVPGVSAADSVIVVSPDYSRNATSAGAVSIVETASLLCPLPAFGVKTLFQTGAGLTADEQPFTFVVP